MWNRYQSSYWRRPDPWQSNTLSHLQVYEDYWEDASVSLKCPEDWGMLQQGVCDCRPDVEVLPPNLPSCETLRDKDRRYFDETDHTPQCGVGSAVVSDKQLCCPTQEDAQMVEDSESEVWNFCSGFPPPMATCATLSIKRGGRFVLKEVNARPHTFFRAQRENGRLRLQLIHPMSSDDEDVEFESEDEWQDLGSEASDDRVLEDETCRIGDLESIRTASKQLQNRTSTTNTQEISHSVLSEEAESGVGQNVNEREDAVVASFGGNGLMNRIVESIQVDNCLGYGGQASSPQSPSSLWVAGEPNRKICSTSQIFLPQPLTIVSPVVGY